LILGGALGLNLLGAEGAIREIIALDDRVCAALEIIRQGRFANVGDRDRLVFLGDAEG